MAGTNILVRQKDLIAGAGISITPDTTSGNVTIAATNTAIDEARLLPENAEANNLVIKRVGDTGIDGNTYLMLHFDEESGAPVDSSQSGLSVTANSTTTTTVGKFNRALNLNNSYLSLTCPAMATGTGDFTYEGWFYFNELNKRRGLFGVDMGLYVALWGDNTYGVAISTSGSSWNYNHMDYSRSEATATQGVWQHIALVRHGATVTLYLNGNSILSFDIGADTVITGNMGNNPFRIGYPLGGMSYVADFVDEFRFSTVARWTENFTPPEKAYSTGAESWDPISLEELRDELAPTGVITTGSDRILPDTAGVSSDSVGNPVIFKAISRIDNTYWLCLPLNEDTRDRSTYDVATEIYGTVNIVSSAPSSPGGSAFFNGSSCLHGTLPAQFGSGDFTVRFWMMAPTISSSSQTIFSTRYGDQTDASTFALLCATEGRLFIYSNGDITSRTDTPFTLQPSVWYHVAVVRKSGVLTIYVNGEVYNSATFTNSLTRQIFGLGASWTGSSYSEAGTVYLTSLDVLNYAAYDGAFTTPAYQPGILAGAGYEVATDSEFKDMLSAAGIDESRLLPENPANGDIPCFDATATVGGGNDANTRILLHFDADEIKDEAAGNAAPVTITKKTGTITVVEGGKWGKCAKYVTGSMTVATNLDELNANNWVVSGWFNPDENNHGVSYPTWLSMDDSSTNGFMFDSTGCYGESDGPLFYLDTPPAAGTWHWLAIVKYSGGLRFYLNGAFLNEISAQQRANFCSTLAIGGFAGTYAAGSTERTFSGLVDEVRLQYIPDDEITLWTGTSIAVPDAPYSKPQTVGEWGKLNLNLSNIAAGDLLTWNGTGLTKITLAELKAKLDALT